MSAKDVLKKWILRLSSILLPVSLVVTIVLITLSLLSDFRMPRFSVFPFCFLAGSVLWYTGLHLEKRSRFIFAATFLGLTGLLFAGIDFDLIAIPLPVIWPLLSLFVGISFSVSGYLRYGKPRAGYVVPAVAFAGLGFVFFLFSSDIINLSFIPVFLWWFPLILVPTLVSIIIWLFRKNGGDGDA